VQLGGTLLKFSQICLAFQSRELVNFTACPVMILAFPRTLGSRKSDHAGAEFTKIPVNSCVDFSKQSINVFNPDVIASKQLKIGSIKRNERKRQGKCNHHHDQREIIMKYQSMLRR